MDNKPPPLVWIEGCSTKNKSRVEVQKCTKVTQSIHRNMLNIQHGSTPKESTRRHQIHTSTDTHPHTEQSAVPRQTSHSCWHPPTRLKTSLRRCHTVKPSRRDRGRRTGRMRENQVCYTEWERNAKTSSWDKNDRHNNSLWFFRGQLSHACALMFWCLTGTHWNNSWPHSPNTRQSQVE